jgi:class 3 adenylate cyclase
MGDNGGWLSSVTSSSSMSSHDRSGASSSDSVSNPKDFGAASWDGVRPPEGEVTIVFSDISRAASLWEFDAAVMRDATLLHNGLLRDLLKNHHGYEVIFIRYHTHHTHTHNTRLTRVQHRDRTSGEGSFCMAFASMLDAVEWSMDVQRSLMEVEWPKALLEHPGAAEEWDDIHERYLSSWAAKASFFSATETDLVRSCVGCVGIGSPGLMFKGLRVRMGMHVGNPRVIRDPKTRRVEYIGPVVNAAARITAITHGGQVRPNPSFSLGLPNNTIVDKTTRTTNHAQCEVQIVMSREAKLKLNGSALADEHARFINLGKFEMPDNPAGMRQWWPYGTRRRADNREFGLCALGWLRLCRLHALRGQDARPRVTLLCGHAAGSRGPGRQRRRGTLATVGSIGPPPERPLRRNGSAASRRG